MANHITDLRRNAGIKTVKEAAIRLNISSGMLYQVEEGFKKPSPKLAIEIAKLFKCSLEDIFLPYIITNSDSKAGNVV